MKVAAGDPGGLAQSIERWYAQMARQLRGLQDTGDQEALREMLDLLSKKVSALSTLYRPPPPPPAPEPTSEADRLVLALKRSRNRTFGSNY